MLRKSLVFAIVVVSFGFSSSPLFAKPKPKSKAIGAHAELKDGKGEKIGTAVFTQTKGGVEIAVNVEGLQPGPKGIHIHGNGSCVGPDFKSAGDHFNPANKHHGILNPEGRHAGDLPNLIVGKDGKSSSKFVAPDVTLGEGPSSLLKSGGTALVIHSGPDDQKSDPSGQSGSRIACGVIIGP